MRRVKDPQPGRIDSRDTPLQQRVAANTIVNRVAVGSDLLAHSPRNDLLRMKMLAEQVIPQNEALNFLRAEVEKYKNYCEALFMEVASLRGTEKPTKKEDVS